MKFLHHRAEYTVVIKNVNGLRFNAVISGFLIQCVPS